MERRDELLMVTTDALPIAHEIEHVWPAVSFTGRVEVSSKGVVRGLLERARNEQQEVYDGFAAAVPPQANAVLGLQVSTAIGGFGPTVLLFVTYTGTPVRYRASAE
jgi:regulator of nucleoside diphosphate kinase